MGAIYRCINLLALTALVSCGGAVKEIKAIPNMTELNRGIDIGAPIVKPKISGPKGELSQMQEGWVLIACDISYNGRPQNIRLISYWPSFSFVESALEYAKDVRYAPYVINGEPSEIKDYYILVKFLIREKIKE